MERERWQRLEELYHAALRLDPGPRAEFVRAQCKEDQSLLSALDSLLQQPVFVDSLFEHPACEYATKLLGFQPEQEARSGDPLIGSTAGSFKVLEKLGAGGMGVVYKALDLKLRREVALKFLPEAVARDAAALERFRREARAASALNHPNICTIYDICEHEGKLFIVMEMMEGMSLRQKLANGPLGVSEVLTLGSDIASGLAAAHSKGIIHRDIKPANILVTADGRAKVLDFGLAKVLPAQMKAVAADSTIQTSLTAPGATVGTIAYMSPEQARGEELDTRSDLFSFGATLYEIATGIPAFQGKSLAEIYDAILNRQPTAASQVNPEIPPHLQEVIAKALNKNPALRYRSAADMGADLQRLRQGLGEAEVTVRRGNPFQGFLASKKSAVIAGCTALIIVVAGLIDGLKPTGSVHSVAVLPFVNAAGAETEYLSEGLTESLTNTLSRIPDLAVRPRSAVMRYKLDPDPLKAGAELSVDAVVTGRVTQRGDDLLVSVELTDTRTNRNLWGDQFDRKMSDLIAVRREISDEITSRLRQRLTMDEKASLEHGGTPEPEAFRLYLEARYFWWKRSPEALDKARDLFTQAIAKDPNYALAYVGLADYWVMAVYYKDVPPSQAVPAIKSAAQRAIALDSRLPEAHLDLAQADFFTWEWQDWERETRKALELNPSLANAHLWYGNQLIYFGRPQEGISHLKRAVDLEPLNLIYNTMLGRGYRDLRNYDQAIQQLNKALEMEPNNVMAQEFLADIYQHLGRYDLWLLELKKVAQLSNDLAGLRGIDPNRAGYEKMLAREISDLKGKGKSGYVDPADIAYDYGCLGDKQEAFFWLEKAYSAKSARIIMLLKREPCFDFLRADARYADLLRHIGIPQ